MTAPDLEPEVTTARRTAPRLSTTWYGDLVNAVPSPRPSSLWSAATCAWWLFVRSGRAQSIIVTEGSLRPVGLVVVSLLLALARRRQLILLEFLPGRKTGWSGRLVAWAYRHLLHRVCLGVQVMTAWERQAYADAYRLPIELIKHVGFYHSDDRVTGPVTSDEDRFGLLASGRNSCDWDTLIDAADGAGWPLTIVCPAADGRRIAERASAAGVTVRTEIPRQEHDHILAASERFLLVLQERGVSSGHVRLASAATTGTPVVTTMVRGLSGYEHLAVEAVPAESPQALREAVDRCLSDPHQTRTRRDLVLRQARQRTYSAYCAEIVHLIDRLEAPCRRVPDVPDADPEPDLIGDRAA